MWTACNLCNYNNIYTANCDLGCILHTESMWTACNLCNYNNIYTANCNLGCILQAESMWTACNLCNYTSKFFQRTLWAVIWDMCNFVLAPKIDFFIVHMKSCIRLIHIFIKSAMQPRLLTAGLSCTFHLLILVVLRWSHTILTSKFTLNSNIDLNISIPQQDLYIRLY
jgi:hypothetical protein